MIPQTLVNSRISRCESRRLSRPGSEAVLELGKDRADIGFQVVIRLIYLLFLIYQSLATLMRSVLRAIESEIQAERPLALFSDPSNVLV